MGSSNDEEEPSKLIPPALSDHSALAREYELVVRDLQEQNEMIHSLGDNATKMLRVVLLLIGGIAAGILNFGVQREVFFSRFCLTSATILTFFSGVFFLVSTSLGIGTALKQISTRRGIYELFSFPHSSQEHLEERLITAYECLEYNRSVLEGNRTLMEISDGLISIGFALLVLLALDIIFISNLNILGSSISPDIFLSGLALTLGSILLFLMFIVDTKFPETHPAKLFGKDSRMLGLGIAILIIIVIAILPHC